LFLCRKCGQHRARQEWKALKDHLCEECRND
jgi:hypothetical protein